MMRANAVLTALFVLTLAGLDSQGQEKANGSQPWLADLDPPKPGNRPAPALTVDYFPHKPGTTRTITQTMFDDEGKPSSVIVLRSEQRDRGVIVERLVKQTNAAGTVSISGDFVLEFFKMYEVKDGFVRVGHPQDPKKLDSPVKWYQELKVGAKPGDRWSSVPGKTEFDKEYKAAGTYKGKPCVVVTEGRRFTLFVEGVGKVLYRSYSEKGGKLVLFREETYE